MAVDRSLEVQLAPELLRMFFPLFQEGVDIEVEVGCSVKQLLTEQLGIAADYLAGRITTLFLNSRAIDDAATALVNDGAVLALSGAMPGLVGATMRSGGYYAAMRGAMTYHGEAAVPEAKRGIIRLKLFNLLIEELSPRLLRRGILLDAVRWKEFLDRQPEQLRVRGYWIDSRPVPVERFRQSGDFPDGTERLRLKVHFGDEAS